MVKNEKYIKLLKSIISCINNGDYSAAKELSYLELKEMLKNDEKIKKVIKKRKYHGSLKKYTKKPLEEWENREMKQLMENYSKYIIDLIGKHDSINQLKKEAITINEFINRLY